MNQLSVLIPVYNQVCVDRVKKIKELCDTLPNLEYEILVADDGSSDEVTIAKNSYINSLGNCNFICKISNDGSSVTRNFLAKQSKYDLLLFIDCDMDIPDDKFIIRYIEALQKDTVINGGIKIGGNYDELKNNLRYLYEHHEEAAHTAKKRNMEPYKCFRSTNFIIPKDIFMSILFDERMKRYEDVFLGKMLEQKNIKIVHIDNPVIMNDFEENNVYLNKIELDINVLFQFRKELHGYSRLLTYGMFIKNNRLLSIIIKTWHKLFKKIEREILVSNRPCLNVLIAYRIGYFISVE